jgi:fluoroacetyl-CoA thioesterase
MMPKLDLQPGIAFRRTIVVEENFTGQALSQTIVGLADMPPVLSTAFMVGLIECTCIGGLRPYLLEGEHTVGTLIDVSHMAATPIGMRVTAEARLVAVVGRKLRFLVTCHDEHEVVGKGNHERTLIRPAGFVRRAESKRTAAV